MGEQADASSPPVRGNQSSDGSDGAAPSVMSPPYSASAAQGTDSISRESESGERVKHMLFSSFSFFKSSNVIIVLLIDIWSESFLPFLLPYFTFSLRCLSLYFALNSDLLLFRKHFLSRFSIKLTRSGPTVAERGL